MTTRNNSQYVGDELELFAHAINWRSYWTSKIVNYLRGRVLEVGAGIGTNTKNLYHLSDNWTALEPDASQSAVISNWLHASNTLSANVLIGTLSTLDDDKMYDAILYIDVLEHIEFDRQEVINAYHHLAPGGVIIILSPAHDFLYSLFDKSIGRYRRYSLLASLGNKLIMKSSMPTKNQILFWDRVLVPVSKVLDRIFRFKVGKSILAIWQKPR